MDTHDEQDPFTADNLPPAVHAQALKLLASISQAHSPEALRRTTDRAEGFVLGLATVRALSALSLEALHIAFNNAAIVRRRKYQR